MHKKIAFIFPGQGAQYIGMGKDFYDQFPTAKQIFEEANDLLQFSLSNLIFNGSPSELVLTKNSQIAIYVTSMAILQVLKSECPELAPFTCAGLSLGEYSALTAAGIISFADGVKLVRRRGELMHEATISEPGTMAAILGMDEAEIATHLPEGVWIANLNCPGQVVISGTKSGVADAMQLLKEKGARRAMELDVSGAFHSGLMKTAEEGLSEVIDTITLQPSGISVVMNVTGDFPSSAEEIHQNLVRQLTSPVRWQKSIEAIEAAGADSYFEIGPGRTLQGMNRKIAVKNPTISLEKVQDLDKLLATI